MIAHCLVAHRWQLSVEVAPGEGVVQGAQPLRNRRDTSLETLSRLGQEREQVVLRQRIGGESFGEQKLPVEWGLRFPGTQARQRAVVGWSATRNGFPRVETLGERQRSVPVRGLPRQPF